MDPPRTVESSPRRLSKSNDKLPPRPSNAVDRSRGRLELVTSPSQARGHRDDHLAERHMVGNRVIRSDRFEVFREHHDSYTLFAVFRGKTLAPMDFLDLGYLCR